MVGGKLYMFRRNLTLAFRRLTKYKRLTFINIFGLLVGITSSILILLWVQSEVRYDQFHDNIDQVYTIYKNSHYPNGDIETTTSQTARLKEALEQFPEVEMVTRFTERAVQLSFNDRIFKGNRLLVDPAFFQMFDHQLVLGDIETCLATGKEVVLTEAMAIKLFGRVDVLGESLQQDNDVLLKVSGIVKDPPLNGRFRFDCLTSVDDWTKKQKWTQGWQNGAVEVYLKLKDQSASTLLDEKVRPLIKQNTKGRSISELFLFPFKDEYLNGKFKNGVSVGGRIAYVKLLTIAALFIVLVACINAVNLATADSFRRGREVGIRKVAGASKRSLVFQLMTESAIVVCSTIILSLILMEFLLPYFNELTGKQLFIDFQDPVFTLALIGMVLVITMFSGLYPAMLLSGFRTVSVLKGKMDAKGASGLGSYMRKGLVLFQFAVSGLLIFATITIHQQVGFIFNDDRNLERENMIVLQNDESLIERYDGFKEALLQNSSIEAVTCITELPSNVQMSSGDPTWEGKNPEMDIVDFKLLFTNFDFIETMNLQLVAGRDYSGELSTDSIHYIINEAAARVMGMEDPVGKKMAVWKGTDGYIIGVVRDFYLNSIHEEIAPLIICNWKNYTDEILIRAAKGKTKEALTALEKTHAAFMPGFVFEYRFMDEAYELMYRNELMVRELVAYFGIVSILISCLGLFGLTSIQMERRIKEIGVRKVLGASVSNLLILFSRRSLVLPLIALLLVTPFAYWLMNDWLSTYAYRINIKVWMFVLVDVMALLIALLTVCFIAVRFARKNPVESLRYE